MQRTLSDFVAVVFAAGWFGVFFVPPGYLFAQALNVQGFRGRSLVERLLWAVTLSAPVSTLIAVFAGRHLSNGATTGLILGLLAGWIVLLGWQGWGGRLTRRTEWDRHAGIAFAAMLGLGLYCVLATLGITVGHKLYEGAYAGDWSVRIPLTAAAIRGGVPPLTPFYGVYGASAPLRYYYYWYVLCGAVGRMAHATARPVLAASGVWSAFALVATLFLYAKHLFRVQGSEESKGALRRRCLWMLPVGCVLGLDVLPAIAGLLLRPAQLYPEMEWWRSQGDYSLSFHTAVLYAPHHAAGLAMCTLGFLLLSMCARRHLGAMVPWRVIACSAVAAGVCFAAALGTSTYLTVIFTLACMLLAVERGLVRDWRAVIAIALAGMAAAPLAGTYLHEILSGAATALHANNVHLGRARFVAVFPRNFDLTRVELVLLRHKLHQTGKPPMWEQVLLRPVLWVLLFAIELGFFGFVLLWRAWCDLRQPRLLTTERRMQWVLFAALAFAALLLTSEPVIGVNDLGRHAGLALRFVAVLWATPLLLRGLKERRYWPLPKHRLVMQVVYATVILGLLSQVWQAVVQRSYFWMVDRGSIRYPYAPFPRFEHYGRRYFEAREAFEAMDRKVPVGGRVQFNPGSTYWTLMTDYLERPVAAVDLDCNVGFGGDLARCHAAMPEIRGLFGGGRPIVGQMQTFEDAGVTPAAFDRVCAEHGLKAVIVTASDRVWVERSSWVWMRPAMFENASVRVVGCPGAAER